jgi:hypothetical protein
MLTLRSTGDQDFNVFEDGQHIGRIRNAIERTPSAWLWHVQVHIPGPPAGTARTLELAKDGFRKGWEAFKVKHGPEKLAEAYRAMNILG